MKKLIIAILSIATYTASAQQDPHYTQNQFNSNLLLNPAYAGTDPDNTSIGLRYRTQWVQFDGAPETFSFIGDTRIKRLGIGASLNMDKIGINRSFTGDANISYHVPVGSSNDQLSFGMKLGYSSVKADFTQLTGITPGDPLYVPGAAKIAYPFIGAGLLYYTPKFYIGASMPQYGFNDNTVTGNKFSATHSYLYGGYRAKLNDDIEMRPAVLLKYQSKAPLELDIAVDTWYRRLVGFGVGYRTGDAVNFMIKGNYKKVYGGYSYDMNISKLRVFNTGSHEIFLGYRIPRKAKGEADQDRNQNGRYF
jgi:type IX secretion system PorP/SprF family membrane protein